MGMRNLNAITNRVAVRALDAARLRCFEGFGPSIKTEGQRLPRELGSPV